MRRREAEAQCPDAVCVDADDALEARTFEIVARAVETLTPRVVLDRPGLCAFATRGPSRYFGGDDALAGARARQASRPRSAIAHADVRIGIADGGFAARLAARRAAPGAPFVVEPGASAAFCAPWPVAVLDDPELASLLVRLGLPTLGDVAALPADAVLARFGADGRRFHDLARGLDAGPPVLVTPPPDLVEQIELDPPVARVDAVAFAAKGLAARLLFRLAERGLACTRVVIEAETEHGERLARCWRHDRVLTPGRARRAGALAARRLAGGRGEATTTISTTPPAGSRCCGSSPTRSCPPTVASSASGAATRPRTTAPTARSRACRACSATRRSRPRWCRAGARRPSRCGGCRGATRANRSGRWWSTRSPTAWPGALPAPFPARVLDPPAPAQLSDEHGRRGRGVGARRAVGARRRASSARCCRAAVARCAGGPGRGPPTCGGGIRSRAGGARAGRWSSTAAPTRGDVACVVVVEAGRAGVEAIYD